MKTNIQMCFGKELAGGEPAPSLLSLEHPKRGRHEDEIFTAQYAHLQFTSAW